MCTKCTDHLFRHFIKCCALSTYLYLDLYTVKLKEGNPPSSLRLPQTPVAGWLCWREGVPVWESPVLTYEKTEQHK